MTVWAAGELEKIGSAEELQIITTRQDGTPRNPVTIWVVRVGDDLYVRSAYGRTSAWFRGVLAHSQGRIRAGGIEKDVNFVEETNPDVNARIDQAYLTKYSRYPQYVAPMVTAKVRAATIKLEPRETS